MNPNKINRFWQELKRRRVVHVTIVYATSAFVILELINNIAEPLHLPDWTPTLIIILLAIGFPVALIFSWIFDVTPEGVEKTKPFIEGEKVSGGQPKVSGSWKIATYVSMVVILGLVAFNIFGGKQGAAVDESLTKSIAVLPFKNFSTDPDQDANCFGLTDEIINHLFKIESFDKVASLSSVLTYRESDKRVPEIAEELQVNYMLEGTYKKIGDQVRVTAQLIEAKADRHLWQQEYDSPYRYDELMAIQSDIALQIADHIKAFLSSAVKQNIQKIPETNQEAFEILQLADYYSYANISFAPDSQSLELALKAIDLDPGYADAYVSAGAFIIGLANYGGGMEMRTAGEEGFRYLQKALELDPDNAKVHRQLAIYYDWYKYDYIKAEAEWQIFFEHFPGNTMWYSQYGEMLIKVGRLDDAGVYLSSLLDSWFTEFRNLRRLIYSGKLGEARPAFEQFKETHTESDFFKWIGEIYLWLGEYDSALNYLESAEQAGDQEMLTVPRHRANLALTCYRLGDTQRATSIIDEVEAMSQKSSAMSPAFFTGWYYSAIGEADSAFHWLEKAYENRSPEMPWLKVDPVFESLKGDDRYWDLYERTGHKAYDEYMASRNP